MPAAVLAILVTAAVPSAAQDSLAAITPKALCVHARPRPACAAFLLTSIGPSLLVSGRPLRRWGPRIVADYGFMANVSTSVAIGASVLLSLDDAEFLVGPAARFRRWMSPRASLEIAVGTPVWSTGYLYAYLSDLRSGSILGLVRWSPAPWLAVTARPERRRYAESVECVEGPPVYCPDNPIVTYRRTSIGMEVSEVPGLVVTAASGVAFLVAALVVATGH